MSNIVIYATGKRKGDEHPRIYTPILSSASQARAWFRKFINNQEHYWEDDKTIVLEAEFTIRLRCDSWEAVFTESGNEVLPIAMNYMILRFKYGAWEEEPKPAEIVVKPAKVAVEVKTKTTVPDGYISITDLCKGTNIAPTNARAILRAVREKPPYGWAFAPNEIPAIRKLIGA